MESSNTVVSPDNEVIERSAGEPAVFSTLYDRHATAVFRYAAQRLGDHAADDVMSETFLVAFERRAAYDATVVDARPWLLGIATRLIRKHARLEATAWKGMSADLAAQIAPDLIDQASARIDAERLTRRLGKALRRLSDADRDTLLLYAWGDLDYASIAAAMQVPIGTVRSRLNRARHQLRRAAGIETIEQETNHGRADAAAQHA
ncbi:sigma-70 family RNA polymerase sigma factor [Microbacterium sp. M3]|uniref:Sigma-70 family RNA polymerase sigma factor n=1 Tax=Microbacterium arthrosphaerae TaxID=792652 RepID=A0ABU4H0P7_9MICO|nr:MULTISPECIES: sigma-70 family RNA polymerase sigma factor [Microbacterium]MDW4572903.1 sigma-70 family RNA polymerase sigma factor [Microbacterium arthrosphaerae]MDW7606758.1 sigma-70 family RNA polymerase sigma factor [Microbacterium sp. M3]